MSKNVKDQIAGLQEALGEVDFHEMMQDINLTIIEAYSAKIDEYIARVPKTDEALVAIAGMAPGAFISVLLELHRGQRVSLGTDDTPIMRMVRDSVELFLMSETQVVNTKEYLEATQH